MSDKTDSSPEELQFCSYCLGDPECPYCHGAEPIEPQSSNPVNMADWTSEQVLAGLKARYEQTQWPFYKRVVEHAEDAFDTGWVAGYESAQVDLAHMERQADEIERLTRELESEKHYAATQQAEKEHWAGTADQQQDIIDRLRAENEKLMENLIAQGLRHAVVLTDETPATAREALNIGQKIGQVATLELAREVIASAYQAVACLVLREPDKRPSDADEIRLLDMLSCWEEWSAEEIESFLPWPKEWQSDKTS